MQGSSFPKIGTKYRFDAMVTSEKYMRKKSIYRPKGMVNAVFVYSDKLLRYMIRVLNLERTDLIYKGYLDVYISKERGLMLIKLGVGAPLTASTADELVYWGIKNFYIMGSSGSLSRSLPYNGIVVCTKAVRDEGTSHHYMKASLFSYPDKSLVIKAKKAVDAAGFECYSGPSWTIDAPYRETFKEVKHYRDIGVLTVEMEASALFAVATVLKARSCAIFAISDILDEEWSGFNPSRIIGYKNLACVAEKLFPKLKN